MCKLYAVAESLARLLGMCVRPAFAYVAERQWHWQPLSFALATTYHFKELRPKRANSKTITLGGVGERVSVPHKTAKLMLPMLPMARQHTTRHEVLTSHGGTP